MPAEPQPANPGDVETRPGEARDDELVMNLVEMALARPAADREPFITNACAGDPSLFKHVWSYVKWEQRMNGFLLDPLYPSPPAEPGLEPGQLLDGRFRIVRLVAEGGMGVVYEAMDEKLDRRIAIKCAKTGFHARLPPEVRHASEISHPNVCKTFEIHTASTSRGEIEFLTMEFIDGQTLADRLRASPVPKEEARTIAVQLCAGLAEAHRHQVIHGDLKSNNVLLAPVDEDPAGGVRAVITDFGLARRVLPQQSPAMSGELAGSLDYMAPELLKGARPSAVSDTYALGVILHELACGRKPFDSGTPWEERLTRRPAPLKHSWSRLVERCLEPDPARRTAVVDEVGAALVPSHLLRWWSIAAAAVLVAAVAGAAGYRTVATPRDVVRLAVLPFETPSESKVIADGLIEDATARLRRVKNDGRRKLTVIPMSDAIRNRVDGPRNAAALLGATHTLTGTVRRDNGRTIVRAWLSDARNQVQLKDWQAEYLPNELRNMPVALAGVITGTLRLPPLTMTATVNSAAWSDFTAGVGLLQRDTGVDAALPLLERAVAADPDSPLARARLAQAQALKYRRSHDPSWLDRASASLADAGHLNPDLPAVWLVSGMIGEYSGRYEKAESDLGRALEIDPRDGDAWHRLGKVYKEDNRFTDAEAALRKAIELQPEYFANYQDLCALYTDQANYDEAIRQCQKVVQLTPDLSAAHFALAVPYFNAGNAAKGESELRLAIKLDPASSNALQSLGVTLFSEGRFTEAIPWFQRAIEAGPATHLLYSNLGTTNRLAGLPSEAREAYRKGLALAEAELAKNPRDAISRAQLAYLCARLGQRTRAESEAAQARQLAPESVAVTWPLLLTREALNQRGETLALLRSAPDDTLRRVSRSPDLADLRADPRFQQMTVTRHIRQ
jgi:tetratricopeptide (TPR) repeat protein/TolB-like protein